MKKTVFFSTLVTAAKYIGAGLATIGVAGAVSVLALFLLLYLFLMVGILLKRNVCFNWLFSGLPFVKLWGF